MPLDLLARCESPAYSLYTYFQLNRLAWRGILPCQATHPRPGVLMIMISSQVGAGSGQTRFPFFVTEQRYAATLIIALAKSFYLDTSNSIWSHLFWGKQLTCKPTFASACRFRPRVYLSTEAEPSRHMNSLPRIFSCEITPLSTASSSFVHQG